MSVSVFRRHMRHFFLLALLLLILSLFTLSRATTASTIPHYGPTPTSTPIVLFEDDFESGNAKQWTVLQGEFDVVNGAYGAPNSTCSGPGHITVAGDDTWTDYSFKFDIYTDQGADKKIVFRWSDIENHYGLHIITIYGGVVLERFVEGDISAPADAGYIPLVNGQWYTFRVDVEGPRIRVYLYETLIIDYEEPGTYLEHGKIGNWVHEGGAICPQRYWIDNVLVTSIGVPDITPTTTQIPTLTPSNTPLSSATSTPTATQTPTPTASNTPPPGATFTPTSTWTVTPTPSNTPPPGATFTPTSTWTPSPTPSNTPSPSATFTPTLTSTPVMSDGEVYIPIVLRQYAFATPAPATPTPTATNTPLPTCEVLDHEPNNFFVQANANLPLCEGATVVGSVAVNDIDDFYRVQLDNAATVRIDLTGIPIGADYDLYLYDASGGSVTVSANPGSSGETIRVPLSSGRYYIRIYSLNYADPNTYQLRWVRE